MITMRPEAGRIHSAVSFDSSSGLGVGVNFKLAKVVLRMSLKST